MIYGFHVKAVVFYRDDEFNGVSENYPKPTSVAMVTKSGTCQQKRP